MKSGGFVECKYHHVPWGGRSHRERTENAMFWILAESPYFPGNERENRRYLLNEMFHRTREYCGNKDYIIQSIVYGKCPNRPRGYRSPFGYVDLGQNAQCMRKGQYVGQYVAGRQVPNNPEAGAEQPPPNNNPEAGVEAESPNISPGVEAGIEAEPPNNSPEREGEEEVKVIRIGNEQNTPPEPPPEHEEIPPEPVESPEPEPPISPYEPIGFRTRSRRTKRTRSGRAYGDYFGSSVRAHVRAPDLLPVPSMFTSPQPGMQSTLVTLNIPDDDENGSMSDNDEKSEKPPSVPNTNDEKSKKTLNVPNTNDEESTIVTKPPSPPPCMSMNLLWDKPMINLSPSEIEAEWEKVEQAFHQRVSHYKAILHDECHRDAKCSCSDRIYRDALACLDEIVQQWTQHMNREKQRISKDSHHTGISWAMKLEQLKQDIETEWVPRLYRCVHDVLMSIRRRIVEDRKERTGVVRRISPPVTSSDRRVIMYKIQNLEHESYLRHHHSSSQLVQMRNREIFQNAKRRLMDGLRRYGFEWVREQLQPMGPAQMDKDIHSLIHYWKEVSGSDSTLTPKQWRLFLKTCFPGESASVEFIKDRFGFSRMVWAEAMSMYRRVVDPRTSLCLKVWARKIQNKY